MHSIYRSKNNRLTRSAAGSAKTKLDSAILWT
jgi:hypothetical protein